MVSSSAEIKQTAAGWEVAVPRVGLPADRRLNLVATLDSAFLRGGATVVLGHDPAPAVQIPLHINRSALVRGTVVDSQGRSLAGARVSVEGFPESITTGRTGSFELPAHAADGQSVRVRAEHSGFTGTTTTVLAGETPVQIVMDRQ